MKKKFILFAALLMILTSCGKGKNSGSVSTPSVSTSDKVSEDTSTSIPPVENTIYFNLGKYGLFDGKAGTDISSASLEYGVSYTALTGTALPGADRVTSSRGVKFLYWVMPSTTGGALIKVEKMPANPGTILEAWWEEGNPDVNPDPIPDGDTTTVYISPVSGVSWPGYYIHFWNSAGDSSTWPGEQMTFDSETGYYKYELDNKYTGIVFNSGGDANKTSDLTVDPNNPVYYLTSVNGAGQWGKIGEDHNPTEVFQWYVIGEMCGWGINDKYGMKSKGNNVFEYTGSFNAGVPFKIVAAAKGNNDWYGGERLDSASRTYVTVDASDNNNMKFNSAGTYTITWNASSSTISIAAA